MDDIKVFEQVLWNPLGVFGLDYSFLKINANTILNTWFILLLLTVILFISRYFLTKKRSPIRYLVISGVSSFMDLVSQTLGTFVYHHFALIFSLFLFILTCNCIAVVPWTTEPTQDLNTTLALGLISFFYKDFYSIKTHGFLGYLKEFFIPFFLMFPVNVIGHFSKVISISFRLFGNIFGGSIIMGLYHGFIEGSIPLEFFGLFSGLNFLILLFFGIFEGLIQAFVFSILTLTYLSLALQEEPQGES
jgi:F-type H+-transporting ATPase subunit a